MDELTTFQTHLNELMKNPEFARRYEEEKRRVGLAIKIAELRQSKELSQSELAKRSGITQQQLSKLEHGENCNLTTFLKVCNSLGVEISLNSAAIA